MVPRRSFGAPIRIGRKSPIRKHDSLIEREVVLGYVIVRTLANGVLIRYLGIYRIKNPFGSISIRSEGRECQQRDVIRRHGIYLPIL